MSLKRRIVLPDETEAMQYLWREGFEQYDWPAIFRRPSIDDSIRQLSIRDAFIAKFGFAILNGKTIETLRPYAPILDVGAGSAYWSYELNKNGVTSIPIDPGTGRYWFGGRKPEPNKTSHTNSLLTWEPWMPIERIDGVTAVQKYPSHTLMMVWPDMEEWPTEVLAAYRGNVLIYVGEGEGGCTGNDSFHALLDTWTEDKYELIPQFFGIHDVLRIFRRGE